MIRLETMIELACFGAVAAAIGWWAFYSPYAVF